MECPTDDFGTAATPRHSGTGTKCADSRVRRGVPAKLLLEQNDKAVTVRRGRLGSAEADCEVPWLRPYVLAAKLQVLPNHAWVNRQTSPFAAQQLRSAAGNRE